MAAHQHLAGNHSHTNKFFREKRNQPVFVIPQEEELGLSSPDFTWQGESCPPFSLPALKHGIVSFLEAVTPEFQPFIRLACL